MKTAFITVVVFLCGAIAVAAFVRAIDQAIEQGGLP